MFIVLDSNIYLHFRSFEDIPWPTILGYDEITIVVPSVILEEIDKIKDLEKGKIQKRAKSVSSRLGEVLINGKRAQYPIRFLECPEYTEEDRKRYHLSSNDNQILFSVYKSEINNDDVCVVSSDNAMLLRAKSFGFQTHQLADDYRLQSELTKEEKEAQSAIDELARIHNRQPRPKLVFSEENDFLQIKRRHQMDIDTEVRVRMEHLSIEWPEKTVEDGQEYYMGHYVNLMDSTKIADYNISRKRFLQLSEKKIRLEVEREDLNSRMVRIAIFVLNGGSSPTGKMNIFLDIPNDIKLYFKESKKKVDYEKPESPSFFPELAHPSYVYSIHGYHNPSIEIWDLANYVKEKQLRLVTESLNHTLKRSVFEIFVDSATCPNFKMDWSIVDANLIDPVCGELNVCFVD